MNDDQIRQFFDAFDQPSRSGPWTHEELESLNRAIGAECFVGGEILTDPDGIPVAMTSNVPIDAIVVILTREEVIDSGLDPDDYPNISYVADPAAA